MNDRSWWVLVVTLRDCMWKLRTQCIRLRDTFYRILSNCKRVEPVLVPYGLKRLLDPIAIGPTRGQAWGRTYGEY